MFCKCGSVSYIIAPPPKYSMLLPNAKFKFLHTCNSKHLSFCGRDGRIGQCGSRLTDSGMDDRGLKVLLKKHKAKVRTLAVFWYGLRCSCCDGPICIPAPAGVAGVLVAAAAR